MKFGLFLLFQDGADMAMELAFGLPSAAYLVQR